MWSVILGIFGILLVAVMLSGCSAGMVYPGEDRISFRCSIATKMGRLYPKFYDDALKNASPYNSSMLKKLEIYTIYIILGQMI